MNSVTFSTDGSLLASGSSDATVKLWDVSKRQETATLPVRTGEVRSVALSPDGKTVAAGTRYGVVVVWDVDSRKQRAALKGHDGEVWSVAFADDGKTLVSGGGDWKRPGEIKAWEATNWRPSQTLRHTGEVLCIAIAPKWQALAAGSWDGTIKIWGGRLYISPEALTLRACP